jgi:hypothetical protein
MNSTSHITWIAQQRRQLGHHVQQCSVRSLARNAALCLDALHRATSGRFLTMICGVAVLMLVPAVWA